VWIRACLNEASLHSYLILCSQEPTRLSQLYAPDALIMDGEFLNQMITHVECKVIFVTSVILEYSFTVLEELRFRLDLSSPLLNTWDTSNALQWLGLKPTLSAYDSLASCGVTDCLELGMSSLSVATKAIDISDHSSSSSSPCCALIDPTTRDVHNRTRIAVTPTGKNNFEPNTHMKNSGDKSPVKTRLMADSADVSDSLLSCIKTVAKNERVKPHVCEPSTSKSLKNRKILHKSKQLSRESSDTQVHSSVFWFNAAIPIGSNSLLAGSWRNLQRLLSAHVEMDSAASGSDRKFSRIF
ncbi:hypothetical protein FBUS_06125, partial [Fasciolopsis buskii]